MSKFDSNVFYSDSSDTMLALRGISPPVRCSSIMILCFSPAQIRTGRACNCPIIQLYNPGSVSTKRYKVTRLHQICSHSKIVRITATEKMQSILKHSFVKGFQQRFSHISWHRHLPMLSHGHLANRCRFFFYSPLTHLFQR